MARFVALTDEEVADLLTEKRRKNTVKSTNVAYKCLQEFIKAMEIPYDENILNKQHLDEILVKFYGGVRTEKGEYYKLNSFRCIKYGLQRYYSELFVWDICNDMEFTNANTSWNNVAKILKAVVKAKQHITKKSSLKIFRKFMNI